MRVSRVEKPEERKNQTKVHIQIFYSDSLFAIRNGYSVLPPCSSDDKTKTTTNVAPPPVALPVSCLQSPVSAFVRRLKKRSPRDFPSYHAPSDVELLDCACTRDSMVIGLPFVSSSCSLSTQVESLQLFANSPVSKYQSPPPAAELLLDALFEAVAFLTSLTIAPLALNSKGRFKWLVTSGISIARASDFRPFERCLLLNSTRASERAG